MSNAQYLASLVNSSGNINIPVSNAGINFNNSSAIGASTLTDYETGSWTPTDASGAGLTFTSVYASYVKIGKTVTVTYTFNYPTTVNTASTSISGLPFTSANNYPCVNVLFNNSTSVNMVAYTPTPGNLIYFYTSPSGFIHVTNAALSGIQIIGSLTYLATA